MATAALAQEKVWFDKPSYDRALRQHFERLAKVVSHKIKTSCPPSSNIMTKKLQEPGNGNNLKSKTKKCKDNRTVENGANDTKHSKSQQKHVKFAKKEDNYNMPKIENVEQKEKSDAKNVKEVEINIVNETAEKNEGKQAKEEKNKADKKHRNKEKGKFHMEEQKEQSPLKGTQQSTCPILSAGGSLANEVAKARQHIKQSLQCMDDIAILAGVSNQPDVVSRVAALEKENQDLRNIVQELRNVIDKLDDRVKSLEGQSPVPAKLAICPAKPASVPAAAPAKDSKDDDDDVDLFGSDSEGEDEEAAKIREQRLAAYAAKKSKKPVLIAKSNIILDVKPWDDETDMKAMESEVRKIEMDGLLWGAAKLVPLAYGICKLQISCVVEDDKVSVDALTEKIQDIEDFVQSVDIAAFNKV